MQHVQATKHALLKRSMFEEYRSAGLKRTSPISGGSRGGRGGGGGGGVGGVATPPFRPVMNNINIH